MLQLANGWQLSFDYSPEWLFIRVGNTGYEADSHPPLTETVWSLSEEHEIYRLVFELEDEALLNSYLIGQLILRHKRAHISGGVVRLWGLSPANYHVLEIMRLAGRFPDPRRCRDGLPPQTAEMISRTAPF